MLGGRSQRRGNADNLPELAVRDLDGEGEQAEAEEIAAAPHPWSTHALMPTVRMGGLGLAPSAGTVTVIEATALRRATWVEAAQAAARNANSGPSL